MGGYYHVGDLAQHFGVSSDTLRLYDKMGILPTRKNAHNGYRVYTRADLICLDYILRLRQTGMPLADIRVLVNEGSLQRAAQMMQRQGESVRARIDELETLYAVTQDYQASFERTLASLGKPTLVTAPRTICRRLDSSFFEALRAFDALEECRMPRLSFLTPRAIAVRDDFEEQLAQADPAGWDLAQLLVLTDESGVLTVPEDAGFTVLPPRRCLFSSVKCYTGRDYSGYAALIRFAREQGLTICGDMLSIAVSLRNNIEQSVDYYQVWLPVELGDAPVHADEQTPL